MRRNLFILFSVLILGTIGCGSTDWASRKPDLSALKPAGPPATAIAVWEPAIKHQSDGESAKRGFGGRVYFYDQDQKKPVRINGSVVVYAFDEGEMKPHDSTPTRSYYFAKDDVKKLYSKSKLGHSYNLWVPWDGEGPDGNVKKVSLIVRYVPEKGSSVVSSQAVVYLPGQKGQSELIAKTQWEQQSKNDDTIRRDSFERESALRGPKVTERLVEANDNRPHSMQTATISVPNALVAQSMMASLMSPAPQSIPQPIPHEIQEIQPASYAAEPAPIAPTTSGVVTAGGMKPLK